MAAIADATDQELEQYRQAIVAEQARRDTLVTAEAKATELNTSYLAAAGVEPGQEWKQPTSAVDAYPKDWTVEHGNKTWVSLVAANVWEPSVSGWREVVAEGSTPEWVQPTGAHDAYQTGDKVMFEGDEYVSLIDANTWSPSAYPQGWELVA
ncbi:Hypothetical protein ROUS_27 [Brevibacterium phage Rousseau]|nr:Hypothetical protein ROUS_27 [Brevibacterium phage Rousseau]